MLEHLLIVHFEYPKFLFNVANGNGYTPIIQAAILGDVESLTLLIKRGADIESRDFKGRTAAHHAAIEQRMAVIYVLNAYRANLESIDLKNDMPSHLVGEAGTVFKNALENIINGDVHIGQVNFVHSPPENIIFKGGGPKGVAYLGGIIVLENRHMLIHVKRIGGTSAGAITATLLATGCNSTEAEELLISTPGTYFLDHPFTEERIEELIKDNTNVKLLKETYDTIFECVTNGSPVPALRAVGLKLANAIWKCTGICAGKRFLDWIETEIAKRTGIHHCTFGELADLIVREKTNSQGRSFKHLHIFATKIGQDTEVDRFSSEDPKYRNLIISEAVRASISIPVVFKPHILIFKRKQENDKFEFYTHQETYTSCNYVNLKETLRTSEHIAEASYIDGGLINNFPIDAFDQRGYIHYGVPEEEKKYSQFNRYTLGFSLYSEKEELAKIHEVKSVENIGQLLLGVYTVFRGAEALMDKIDSDPRNKNRIIALDNQGIGLTDFNTNPSEGKGKKAIVEAEKKTEEFFKKQEKEIEGFISSSDPEEMKTLNLNENANVQDQLSLSEDPATAFELESIEIDETYAVMLRHGLVRTNLAEAIGIGTLGPFFALGKAMQSLIDPIGFERDANWHTFRVLKSLNPSLQLFDHIAKGSIPWVVNKCFEENESFFRHPRFPKAIVPLLVFQDNAEQIQYLASKDIPVNVTSEDGTPLVHQMISFSCYHSFKALIISPDYKHELIDQEGNTVLHRVARHGRLKAYEILSKLQKVTSIVNIQSTA